ncbi:uncharacterized protein GGS22DRAFT_185429 [Annulohypoxylon maeteangense]|uniref:uncharacterized protein n=1 Tax=Annulohypoxylon maeteangense TaxID=1927788 RepID=UPI002007E0D7|nr:uncharacterized protein GGS22DRAFT_185429 [Annulohypoxylon maeteangense]KAI0888048.1 hypothetical protein GGS22DRAFT_185429 [Annulohypoxylon maeteangense]
MKSRTKYSQLAYWHQPIDQKIDQQKTEHDWKDGDIAFLKDANEFTRDEYNDLIRSGYLHFKATKHPVIILEHSNDHKHFLITTVSAYSSGRENNYLPPWKQFHHKCKPREAFRAFSGSAKPSYHQNYLQIADGGSFPKPETSWVYMPATFVVPSSALKEFDKTPERLRMTKESLDDLLYDMAKNARFATRWTNPHVLRLLRSKAPQNQKCWQNYNRWGP